MAVRFALRLVWILICTATVVEARQREEEIARSIVIGQAYASGNIVVAGFIEDVDRLWPQTITLARLFAPAARHPSADFVRALKQESPNAFAGAANVDIDPAQDFFWGIDGVIDAHPTALYASRVTVAEKVAVIGWSGTMGVRDISYQNRGQLRPISPRERDEVAAAKQKLPKSIECTTEPQWIDSAKILLTARITNSNSTLRLSSYQNPGCLGHLSTIYVLDVTTSGREPRRFEFRYHQGVL